MIWQDVYTTLHNYSGVSSLVSNRIYPSIVNQDPTYPCISHLQVSEVGITELSGASDLINPNWQIDAWDTSYSGAKALMAQIRSAMDAATLFKSILITEIDIYEQELNIHRVMAEFSLWAKA